MKIWHKFIGSAFSENKLKNICVDHEERFLAHSEVIARKPILRKAMENIQETMVSLAPAGDRPEGRRVELGAGVCPLKNKDPSVLSSDIVYSEYNDLVLDASNLELDDKSTSAIFCQNSFHHFPDPQRFFEECNRVLVNKGRVVILDPYYGYFSSFLFKRLFKNEDFDKKGSWSQIGIGPMTDANQALSYIVFVRDRTKFQNLNPNLKIIHEAPSGTHFSYLISGGLNFIQLTPNWSSKLIFFIEELIQPINRWIAIHHFIVLEKHDDF